MPIDIRLRQGPRAYAEVTRDFQAVANLFLSADQQPISTYNGLGELIVTSSEQTFNLTKILEHNPDFEHLVISDDVVARCEAYMRVHVPEYDADVVEPPLLPAEKMALIYYTFSNAQITNEYQNLNQFLRQHAKGLQDVGLDNEVKIRIMAICLINNAIKKIQALKHHGEHSKELDILFRGEVYANMLEGKKRRLTESPIRQKGFFSTTQERTVARQVATQAKNSNDEDILTIQIVERGIGVGADVAGHSHFRDESEVLFPPNSQFIFKDTSRDQVHQLDAYVVRSIDGVDTALYTSDAQEARIDLISAVDDYNENIELDEKHKQLDLLLEQACLPVVDSDQRTLAVCREAMELTKYFVRLHPGSREELNIIFNKAQALANIIKRKLQTRNHLLVVHAQAVLSMHLDKPFSDSAISNTDLSHVINGRTIHRPNHGLAHVVRVAHYAVHVRRVLMQHCKDDGFLQSLTRIDAHEFANLQIALLCSVSGRDSEVSIRDNPALYKRYRRQTVQKFRAYAGTIKMNAADIDKYAEILLNLGDPVYVQHLTAENAAIYHVINLSHKLDLMRCMDRKSFQRAMAEGIAAIETTVEIDQFKMAGMPELYGIANDMIVETGDRQFTVFEEGELRDQERNYNDSQFITTSLNPQACIDVCAKILLKAGMRDKQMDLDMPDRADEFEKVSNTIRSDPHCVGVYLRKALTSRDHILIRHLVTMGCTFDTRYLLAGIKTGSARVVVELLALPNININHVTDMFGSPRIPLIEAVRGGYLRIASLLINAGANVNIAFSNETALGVAVELQDTAMIRKLLKCGANLQQLTDDQYSWMLLNCTDDINSLEDFIVKRPPPADILPVIILRFIQMRHQFLTEGEDSAAADSRFVFHKPYYKQFMNGLLGRLKAHALKDIKPIEGAHKGLLYIDDVKRYVDANTDSLPAIAVYESIVAWYKQVPLKLFSDEYDKIPIDVPVGHRCDKPMMLSIYLENLRLQSAQRNHIGFANVVFRDQHADELTTTIHHCFNLIEFKLSNVVMPKDVFTKTVGALSKSVMLSRFTMANYNDITDEQMNIMTTAFENNTCNITTLEFHHINMSKSNIEALISLAKKQTMIESVIVDRGHCNFAGADEMLRELSEALQKNKISHSNFKRIT